MRLSETVVKWLVYAARFVVLLIVFSIGGLLISIPLNICFVLAAIGAFVGCIGYRLVRLGLAFGVFVIILGILVQNKILPDFVGSILKSDFSFGQSVQAINPTHNCVLRLEEELGGINNLRLKNQITNVENEALRAAAIKHFDACQIK